MRYAAFGMVAALAGLVAYGCKSSDPSCTLASGCPDSDQVCQFALGDCSGNGTCVTSTPSCDNVVTQVCTCAGVTDMVACSNLEFEEPTRSMGECPIATGTTCQSNDDCDPAALCSFPISGGCNATGTCVAADEACTDPSPEPLACACDGVTMIGLACTYGDGGAPLPVGTLGACPGSVTDAGGILFGDGSGE
jgi:hypothetical protein